LLFICFSLEVLLVFHNLLGSWWIFCFYSLCGSSIH